MARNPVSSFALTFVDWSGEKSSMIVNVAPLDASNIEGLVNHPQTGDAANFASAIDAITDGSIAAKTVSESRKFSSAEPATYTSRIEQKWLVMYEDTTTFRRYSFEIPTAAPTASTWLKANTDEADLTAAPWSGATGVVAYIEAFVLSPDGNAINVIGISLVGRNL